MDEQIWDLTTEEMEKKVFGFTLGLVVGVSSVLSMFCYNLVVENEKTSLDFDCLTVEVEKLTLAEQKEVNEESDILVLDEQDATGTEYVYYNIPMEDSLQKYTQELCSAMGVNFLLVLAIIAQESNFIPDAISAINNNGTRDYGIMQINSKNHQWLEKELNVNDWLNPYQNILAGIYILSGFENLGDDYKKIAMYYNSGPTGASKLLSCGIYTSYSYSVENMIAILDERKR